jgi:hypothetical protein
LSIRRYERKSHLGAETNWSQLSSIGQTYGAISALLTAMALIGVVASPDTVPGSDKTRAAKMAGNLLMAAAAGALVDRKVNRRI